MVGGLIKIDMYTMNYPDKTTITAKQAKEAFFLTTNNDLQYTNFSRPDGMMAYVMKQGSCKPYK